VTSQAAAPGSEPASSSVSLVHVDKVYEGGFKAVQDFNLEIADREFIVLVGPSGRGSCRADSGSAKAMFSNTVMCG